MVADMGAVLFAMIAPTVAFGLFALLAVRYGAESRPYFDERPVVDDRPNWFPIAGSGRGDDDDDEDDDDPQDGEPMPAAEQPESAPTERGARPARPRRQPATVPLASASNAATSPSGV